MTTRETRIGSQRQRSFFVMVATISLLVTLAIARATIRADIIGDLMKVLTELVEKLLPLIKTRSVNNLDSKSEYAENGATGGENGRVGAS